jgi:hypothetical protein
MSCLFQFYQCKPQASFVWILLSCPLPWPVNQPRWGRTGKSCASGTLPGPLTARSCKRGQLLFGLHRREGVEAGSQKVETPMTEERLDSRNEVIQKLLPDFVSWAHLAFASFTHSLKLQILTSHPFIWPSWKLVHKPWLSVPREWWWHISYFYGKKLILPFKFQSSDPSWMMSIILVEEYSNSWVYL